MPISGAQGLVRGSDRRGGSGSVGLSAGGKYSSRPSSLSAPALSSTILLADDGAATAVFGDLHGVAAEDARLLPVGVVAELLTLGE